jgi:drug/metabolite transporter (DMT)-like permease
MTPALWGALCALSLGCADFAARFSSQALGYAHALFGMLAIGAVILTSYVWFADLPLTWEVSSVWLLLLNGVATTVMTMLLYNGLARGPVSIVAPIVASHPALVVATAVILGARPTCVQWTAMAITMLGVLVVARCADRFAEAGSHTLQHLRQTVVIAVAASIAYAVLVLAGQAAVPIYGELQTLWLGRLVSLITIFAIMGVRAERPCLPVRWWPFLVMQGVLDAAGYLFLFAGSHGAGSEIAAVTASTFGAVTTLLAWIILREQIGRVQWGGIALVFVGVAILSSYG